MFKFWTSQPTLTNQPSKKSTFERLPSELLNHIASLCSAPVVLALIGTCRYFHNTLNNREVFSNILKNGNGFDPGSLERKAAWNCIPKFLHNLPLDANISIWKTYTLADWTAANGIWLWSRWKFLLEQEKKDNPFQSPKYKDYLRYTRVVSRLSLLGRKWLHTYWNNFPFRICETAKNSNKTQADNSLDPSISHVRADVLLSILTHNLGDPSDPELCKRIDISYCFILNVLLNREDRILLLEETSDCFDNSNILWFYFVPAWDKSKLNRALHCNTYVGMVGVFVRLYKMFKYEYREDEYRLTLPSCRTIPFTELMDQYILNISTPFRLMNDPYDNLTTAHLGKMATKQFMEDGEWVGHSGISALDDPGRISYGLNLFTMTGIYFTVTSCQPSLGESKQLYVSASGLDHQRGHFELTGNLCLRYGAISLQRTYAGNMDDTWNAVLAPWGIVGIRYIGCLYYNWIWIHKASWCDTW